jgi:hypothetical protein
MSSMEFPIYSVGGVGGASPKSLRVIVDASLVSEEALLALEETLRRCALRFAIGIANTAPSHRFPLFPSPPSLSPVTGGLPDQRPPGSFGPPGTPSTSSALSSSASTLAADRASSSTFNGIGSILTEGLCAAERRVNLRATRGGHRLGLATAFCRTCGAGIAWAGEAGTWWHTMEDRSQSCDDHGRRRARERDWMIRLPRTLSATPEQLG